MFGWINDVDLVRTCRRYEESIFKFENLMKGEDFGDNMSVDDTIKKVRRRIHVETGDSCNKIGKSKGFGGL
jgi:hypothetical protein